MLLRLVFISQGSKLKVNFALPEHLNCIVELILEPSGLVCLIKFSQDVFDTLQAVSYATNRALQQSSTICTDSFIQKENYSA